MQSKQQGMTALGWVVVLGLIAFFAMLVIRVTPLYMEAYSVKSHLQSLQQEPLITKKSDREIKRMLLNRFDIDNVKDVKPKDIEVKRGPGTIDIRVRFEGRAPFFGDLDIVKKNDYKVRLVQN